MSDGNIYWQDCDGVSLFGFFDLVCHSVRVCALLLTSLDPVITEISMSCFN